MWHVVLGFQRQGKRSFAIRAEYGLRTPADSLWLSYSVVEERVPVGGGGEIGLGCGHGFTVWNITDRKIWWLKSADN